MATATMAMGRTAQGFRYVSDAQVKANSPYGLPLVKVRYELKLDKKAE
jgi:hypothetical protein